MNHTAPTAVKREHALSASPRQALAEDVVSGLSQPQKTLPCRWLYDERGSALFEEITELPEYYPTRTETDILEENATAIAAMAGPQAVLIEYGAGASVKTRILLDAFEALASYVPIDVSGDFLRETALSLRDAYSSLNVEPIVGDFLEPLSLPSSPSTGRRVGFFPGSTIGNLNDRQIHEFLRRARTLLGDRALFVLGFDLRKSADILVPAYDDAAGVTAAFNLNLLARINRELNADFYLDAFAHEARWNDQRSRIEMHLVSLTEQVVSIDDQRFHFSKNETIHTENSRKFSIDAMQAACHNALWSTVATWTDAGDLFAVSLLQATTR